MTPTREQIGRILYECEKKRGQHADAVMKGISPKASDALLMEPWEECKDSFLSDADAVLSLFGSAAKQDMTEVQAVAAAILPVVDRIGAFTSEDRALEIAKLAVAALPRSAAMIDDPVALATAYEAGRDAAVVVIQRHLGEYRHNEDITSALASAGTEINSLIAPFYAAPTTSPNPVVADYATTETPEPDAVREALDEAVTLLMDAQCEHPSGVRSANWHTRRRHLLKTSKPLQAREPASTPEMLQWVERERNGRDITLWIRNSAGTHLCYSAPLESSEGDVLVDLEAALARKEE